MGVRQARLHASLAVVNCMRSALWLHLNSLNMCLVCVPHCCPCSLDADGFPTAGAQLASSAAGLQEEPSKPQEGPGATEVLLLEGEQASELDDWARASGSLAGASQVCSMHAARFYALVTVNNTVVACAQTQHLGQTALC